MLELKDVSVSYGRIAAVQGLSLEVKQGEFVGLVGHNGAGKSTTLMTITGASGAGRRARSCSRGSRSSGVVAGRDPAARHRARSRGPPHLRAPHRGREHARSARPSARTARASTTTSARCSSASRCWSATGTVRAPKLSGGEQQQLAIARALRLAAEAAPARRADARARAADGRPRLRDPRRSCTRSGTTILLVEQNAARTIEMADRTYVLRTGGRIQFHGTAAELAEIGDFETAYIGMG